MFNILMFQLGLLGIITRGRLILEMSIGLSYIPLMEQYSRNLRTFSLREMRFVEKQMKSISL